MNRRKTHWAAVGVAVAAVAAAFLPLPAPVVERVYSDGLYPRLQSVMTSMSNAAPIALLDALIGTAIVVWAVLAWRDSRRTGTSRIGSILRRTIVWAATGYLVFLGTWGLNYRRIPLATRLRVDESAVTVDRAVQAARAVVQRLNAVDQDARRGRAPDAAEIDPAFAAAFARALRDVGLPPPAVLARPKTSALDWYFRRSGTDGMTDPFFLETLIATNVLPFERPFVVAHEWSHLAGVADEGEANFVGWLACMRGGAAAQYSGALFLYRELTAIVPPRDRASLRSALGSGPLADLRAIQARYERDVNERLAAAGWRIYDSYLRANRVQAGAASYGEVVKLVLGAQVPDMPR